MKEGLSIKLCQKELLWTHGTKPSNHNCVLIEKILNVKKTEWNFKFKQNKFEGNLKMKLFDKRLSYWSCQIGVSENCCKC